VKLTAGREARRDLAIRAALDARAAGDEAAYGERLAELVDLNARLFDEQYAELGRVPLTIEGCVSVLRAATWIVEMLNDEADDQRAA